MSVENSLLNKLTAIDARDRSLFIGEVARVFEEGARDTRTVLTEPHSIAELANRVLTSGVQITGQGVDEMVVSISVREIADVLIAARGVSFGEALDATNFTPLNRKRNVRPVVNHVPLKRRRGRPKPGSEEG
jgi:hypothetical protein